MKKVLIFLLLLLQFGCTSNKIAEEKLKSEIKSKEETILFYEEVMGAWLSNENVLNTKTDTFKQDQLFFYFSEYQCMDCVYHNLSLLKAHLVNDSLKAKRTYIIGNYKSERDFLATLSRYGLVSTGVNIENRQDANFESDYPILLLKGVDGSWQYEYKASVYTKAFSEFYLNKIYERF